MSDVKVGDKADWANAPNGSMVRAKVGKRTFHVLRMDDVGHYAHVDHREDSAWESWEENGGSEAGFYWLDDLKYRPAVVVVAMGLTGRETAAELQRLAEVYEVREALAAGIPHVTPGMRHGVTRYFDDEATEKAKRLYAAGWRPGMTAEDAARLLAEVRDG